MDETPPLQPSEPAPTPLAPEPIQTPPPKKSRKKLWIIIIAILVLAVGGFAAWKATRSSSDAPTKTNTAQHSSSAKSTASSTVPTLSSSDLKLDTTKNYGDKYANGLLPVGDNKYVTTAPKQGYIYVCHAPQAGGGGAGSRGPWFANNNTQYDINKKATVSGNVSWQSQYSATVSNGVRTIATNDLPNGHTTGIFPIQSSDAAYLYDRNPNRIAAQSLTYTLTAYPQLQSPSCLGGEAGVMTTGVALFDGFDAGGRDAGAWEVQDGCSGHPQKTGEYHYHTLSSCIKNADVHTVIGYALDGFPITGPKVKTGSVLTTADLDECHGITSQITLDGKQVISYHYVMTQDFPYSVSCFRGTAIQPPNLPQ